MRRAWAIGLLASTMIALFAGAYWVGYRVTLGQLSQRGEAALVLVSERLTLQLERHRYLPSVLAHDPPILKRSLRPTRSFSALRIHPGRLIFM